MNHPVQRMRFGILNSIYDILYRRFRTISMHSIYIEMMARACILHYTYYVCQNIRYLMIFINFVKKKKTFKKCGKRHFLTMCRGFFSSNFCSVAKISTKKTLYLSKTLQHFSQSVPAYTRVNLRSCMRIEMKYKQEEQVKNYKQVHMKSKACSNLEI